MSTVLIIEDNHDIAESYICHFELQDHRCVRFTQGCQAIGCLKIGMTPDLIVCDQELVDRIRGDEILDWVGQYRPELISRFVLCSGNLDTRRLIDHDVPFVWKGSDIKELWDVCDTILNQG